MLVVAGVAGVVWGGAALASWLSGHGGISTGLGPALEAALRLPHHVGDPKAAWAAPARDELPCRPDDLVRVANLRRGLAAPCRRRAWARKRAPRGGARGPAGPRARGGRSLEP